MRSKQTTRAPSKDNLQSEPALLCDHFSLQTSVLGDLLHRSGEGAEHDLYPESLVLVGTAAIQNTKEEKREK